MGFSSGCRSCLILGDAGWALRALTLASPALPDPPEHLCWLGPLPSLSLLHRAAGLTGSVLGGKNMLLELWRPQTSLWGLETGSLTCRSCLAWGPCDEGWGRSPSLCCREPSLSSGVICLGQVSAHQWVAPFSSGSARRAVSLFAFSELSLQVFLHALCMGLHGLARPGRGFPSQPCASVARIIVC